MQYWPAMAVSKAIYHLLENSPCSLLIQPLSLFDVLEQVTSSRILHYHQKMFLRLKNLKKPDNATMSDLFKDINFLENFPPAILILHIWFVNCFYRNILAGQLVNSKGNFSKGPLSYQFDELVEVQSGRRDLLVLLDILLDILYQLLPILQNLFIQINILLLRLLRKI